MGLRSDIQEALTEAMDDVDGLFDVVEDFDFIYFEEQTEHDVEEDTKHSVEIRKSARGIFVTEDDNQVKDDKDAQVEEIIVNPVDIEDGLIPTEKMIIELSDGTRYRIVDPGKIVGGASQVVIYNMKVAADVK